VIPRAAVAVAVLLALLAGCGDADPWTPDESDVERACSEVLRSARVVSDRCNTPLPPEYTIVEVLCPLLDPYHAGDLYTCALELRDLTCDQAEAGDLPPTCDRLVEGDDDAESLARLPSVRGCPAG